MIDFEAPKQMTGMEKVTDIDEVPFHKLNLGQDDQKEEEPLEVIESLVPPPLDSVNVEGLPKMRKKD